MKTLKTLQLVKTLQAVKARSLALATALLFLLSVVGLVVVDDDRGGAVVAAAAAATTRTGSAHVESKTEFAAANTVSTTQVASVVDFGSHRSRSTTSGAGIGSFESVTDGTTSYMKVAGTALAPAGKGKPWIAFDLATLGKQIAALGNMSDPAQALKAMTDSGFVRNLEEQGQEEVRGVRTTRWAGEVDPEKMAKFLSSALGAFGSATAVQGLDVRFTAWISDDGLVRRCESEASGAFGPSKFRSTSTTELFDFGEPVQIDIPPADQVRRITSLQELTGG